MRKNVKHNTGPAATTILIILMIIMGYAAMWLLGYYASSDNIAAVIAIQILLIVLALGIAYGILKGVFHNTRLSNRNERELHLRDLPKDAPQPDAKFNH